MSDAAPHRPSTTAGLPVATLGYSASDLEVLAIARHFFAAYAMPECQSWIAALGRALDSFGQARGPAVGLAVLSLTQAIRRTRRSVLHFNAADCACCSPRATGCERLMMSAYRALGRGDTAAARAYAALLCETGSPEGVLAALAAVHAQIGAAVSDRAAAEARGA